MKSDAIDAVWDRLESMEITDPEVKVIVELATVAKKGDAIAAFRLVSVSPLRAVIDGN